jgi:serine/threonine protein kinase
MFGASSAHGSKPWFIVSELYERGSLVEWLLTAARDDYPTLRELDQFRFISQIAGGMEYLHAQGMVHGDLKVREPYDVPTLCLCIGAVRKRFCE